MISTFPQICKSSSQLLTRTGAAALSLAIVFALVIIAAPATQAQSFSVLYTFTYGANAGYLWAGLTEDTAGNFYGTTNDGGSAGYGSVFKLERSGSGWVFTTLYSFAGGDDGAYPESRVVLAPDGSLYGTTANGGGSGCFDGFGCGTVFHLTASSAAPNPRLAPWNETVVYRFSGSDGGNPEGDLTFDQSGNIYGTTQYGGSTNNGAIYELTPAGEGWTEAVLYSAQDSGNCAIPYGGVVMDRSGNLYGVFSGGPGTGGAVYQLSPSQSGWTEQTLQTFSLGGSGGSLPRGGLTFDSFGNLYGSTAAYGVNGGGTVFELTPANGGWTFNTLYNLPGTSWGPLAELVLDSAGNLYGTTYGGGTYNNGTAFKLTTANGGWTYSVLHNFRGGWDGGGPQSNLVFDSTGNLYGTTSWSVGPTPYPTTGNIFEITP